MHLADKLLNNDPATAQLLAPGGNPFLATGAAGEDSAANDKNAGHKNTDKSAAKSGSTAPLLRFVRAELYEVNMKLHLIQPCTQVI